MASRTEKEEMIPQDFLKLLRDDDGNEEFFHDYEGEEDEPYVVHYNDYWDKDLFSWNEPPVVPLGTISSVFDEELRPLAMPSKSSSRASTPIDDRPDSPSVLDPSDVLFLAPVVYDDSVFEEAPFFYLSDEPQQEVEVEADMVDEVVTDVEEEQPQQEEEVVADMVDEAVTDVEEEQPQQEEEVVADMVDEVVMHVVEEQPQQQSHPPRGGVAKRGGPARRRGAAQHGRGRGRVSRGTYGQVPTVNSEWVSGEPLVEVFVDDDDDVPQELREKIMNVKNARKVGRERLLNRERGAKGENEEMGADEYQSFAEGTSNHFEWSPMRTYQGRKEKFLPKRTGAVVLPKDAYGAFRQYWDDDIMSHIVTETNRYAAGLARSSAAFALSWYDTNIHELFILFSFWMMLGIIRMPSIKSCFATNPILETNIFRKMFTRLRYENLCRAFHLADNSRRLTDTNDPLFSLGPILNHLNSRFQKCYIPSQNICVDESLTLWKGHLSIRQYIKTKTAQYGVKTFELCESSTGYLWSFFVYVGAGTSYDALFPSTAQKSSITVLQLMRPLLDKGYTLFLDNWFNSPLLARFLKSRKTDCVGTLRVNRANVPEIVSLCELKVGQFVARHSGDVVVLAFQDRKRKIATISTYHGNSQGQMEAKSFRPTVYKPQVVLDYNMCMGGVDRKDQMLEPYLLERKKCSKWNVKFFKRLLNCSVLNARVLLASATATSKLHIVYRLELVDQILRHHQKLVPKLRHSDIPTVPEAQHFPRKTTEHSKNGRLKQRRRRCTNCSNRHSRRRETPYVCTHCQVPLCIDCFEEYHVTK